MTAPSGPGHVPALDEVRVAAQPLPHAPARPRRGASDDRFRADIQALRAIAVILVVVYHFWPTLLPGGYVGVDVFFVISGFLITAHLRQMAEGPRGLSLMGFYGRRIRRLLPASLLVLFVTTVGIIIWVPKPHWPIDLGAIIASAFYVENWFLAATATDYLSGSVAASNPANHYWSLSTEEQFYLVWPLLILVAGALVARTAHRSITFWLLAGITAASFVTSVVWTASDPSVAYFATPTRAWEFGLGALLTFLPSSWVGGLPRWIRIAAVWLGLALMVVTAITYGGTTAFPGWIALVPVVGALLVIAANQPRGVLSLQPVAELAPVQRVGDGSYAIYLWHWPLLILVPLALGDATRSAVGKFAILIATLVLAWLTRTYVEIPFIRLGSTPNARSAPRRLESRTMVGALAGMLAVALLAWPPLALVESEASAQRDAVAAAEEESSPCHGAASLTSDSCPSEGSQTDFVPGLLIAGRDQSALDGCQVAPTMEHHCERGPADGIPVALVGDSHATQWLLAVEAAAEAYGWRVTTYLAGACPLFLPQAGLPQSTVRDCARWQQATLAELSQKGYEFVLVSAQGWDALDQTSSDPGSAQFRETAAGVGAEYAAAWNQLTAAGSQVIVIADTPNANLAGIGDVPSCLGARGASGCSLPRAAALAANEPLAAGVQRAPGVRTVDFTDVVCPGTGDCPVVIGGVLVWSDGSHLTKTYVRTLEQTFVERIGVVTGATRAD
ncbi:acyltransferase family protein [Microbacterium sp. HJ5]